MVLIILILFPNTLYCYIKHNWCTYLQIINISIFPIIINLALDPISSDIKHLIIQSGVYDLIVYTMRYGSFKESVANEFVIQG